MIGLPSEIKTVKMIETEVNYTIEVVRRDRKAKCRRRETVRGDEEKIVTRKITVSGRYN